MSSDHGHSRSYRRTLLAALAAGIAALTGAHLLAYALAGSSVVLAAGWIVGTAFLCLAACTAVVVYRDGHQRRTGTNLFVALNTARSEGRLSDGPADSGLGLRWTIARLLGTRSLVVGEPVEIRSYDEILQTLDADGCVGALPFMPEMKRFCGRRARVFRRVDKIYDYGRSKTLRRLDDTYLLVGLRCDGSAHGACEAACYLLWKRCWLKPRRAVRALPRAAPAPEGVSELAAAEAATAERGTQAPASGDEPRYRCQFTELAAASAGMSPWDARQDLRPLLSGNVTLRAFALALSTRLFNYVQERRRGVGYPVMPKPASDPPTAPSKPLAAGDSVRVRDGDEIASTLDARGRNRGLWFDLDMLNYCGRRSVVSKRVERIIDDATGLMRTMKSPCIVLEGIDYGGEPLRFVAQEEHLYWRETWLEPIPAREAHAPSGPAPAERSR